MIDQNYLDRLVIYFDSKKEIIEAYFGFAYNDNTKANELILAVYHFGNVQEIQRDTWLIKSEFYPELQLYFASSENDPALFEFVKNNNFSFYNKTHSKLLEQKIMKRWFDKARFETDLVIFLKENNPITLARDFETSSHTLTFQTFIRNSGEFVPLFSDREMVSKCGMTEIPSNLTILEFDWQKLNTVLDKKLDDSFYVLNPGNPFEVEIFPS